MSWDGVHALIRRAQAGDADAWPVLHALARDYLLRLAQRLVGTGWAHRSANDLIQDTWLHVYAAIGDFRGGDNDAQTGATFRALLSRTMRRLHANGLRHDQTDKRRPPPGTVRLGVNGAEDSSVTPGDPPAADPTPSHPLRMEERRARIDQVLANLDGADRVVVELHVFEGRSLKQVAEQLGRTYDQVRYQFHDILDRLGDQLDDWS